MKVGILKQSHNPRQSVVGQQIAEGLRKHGATVRFISGLPTDPSGRRIPNTPILPHHTIEEDVDMTRLPYFPSKDQSAVRRILTYGSFATSSTLAGPMVFRDLDVLLVYGSPVTAASAAMVWSERLSLPYVIHVQDVWPDSVFASGFLTARRSRIVSERVLNRFVQTAYRKARSVVTISDGARDLLLERGVPDQKVATVFNWTDERLFRPREPQPHPGYFTIQYAGNLGRAQDLVNVIRAMALVKSSRVRLRIIGSGPLEGRLRQECINLDLKTIEFLGRVTPLEVASHITTSDVQLISLADRPIFSITIPSKLQTNLASGAPILVSAPGEVGRIVEQSGCGMATTPGDPAHLARTIDRMADCSSGELAGMGRRGRSLYESRMCEAIGSKRLFGILQEACTGTRGD